MEANVISRRTLWQAPLALAFAAHVGSVRAQTFPSGPLRIVVPLPPGGGTDLVARVIGDKVGAELGHPVIIENRGGGSTFIGTQAVARAKPDGQTLLIVQPFNVIATLLQENVPYNLMKDFAPIIGVGSIPVAVAVRASSGIRSITDLAALGRSKDGGVVYSSGGVGALGHLASASFLNTLGVPGTNVPYRGNSDAIQAVVAGQVDMMSATTHDVMELVRSGSLRLLGIATEQRLPNLPDVPTMTELGFTNSPRIWYAYLVPTGTPANVVTRLQDVFSKAVNDPSVKERLASVGLDSQVLPGPELTKLIQSEVERWRAVIARNNIRVDR
jgi:tripartite-type tricarboxylate transporter receptor subunit TctC